MVEKLSFWRACISSFFFVLWLPFLGEWRDGAMSPSTEDPEPRENRTLMIALRMALAPLREGDEPPLHDVGKAADVFPQNTIKRRKHDHGRCVSLDAGANALC
jgi:hypothetical protein